ncbi:hypothetical protein BDZ97DRAFT_1766696 [Flammula alnicola]|nr:hypothetical protein BDZ97DRAFT_1766696 [Flammula alnicola]
MTAFTLFLVTHPSIRYLFLLDVDPFLSTEKMKINMLPDLHTISGTPGLLTRLAAKCDSLKYIRCLVLDFNGVVDYVRNTEILLSTTCGFPNLKHCAVSRIITAATTAQIMSLFGGISIELECWTGGFYYREVKQLVWDEQKAISQVLALFPTLSRLDICEWTYPTTPMNRDQYEALRDMASATRSLRKISLYMPHLRTNEISSVLRIDRNNRFGHDANLARTYHCVEGGPYIQDRRMSSYYKNHDEYNDPYHALLVDNVPYPLSLITLGMQIPRKLSRKAPYVIGMASGPHYVPCRVGLPHICLAWYTDSYELQEWHNRSAVIWDQMRRCFWISPKSELATAATYYGFRYQRMPSAAHHLSDLGLRTRCE